MDLNDEIEITMPDTVVGVVDPYMEEVCRAVTIGHVRRGRGGTSRYRIIRRDALLLVEEMRYWITEARMDGAPDYKRYIPALRNTADKLERLALTE